MDNQSENTPYFGFFQDRNDEYFHIRANKEGLIYLANQLLDKAEKLDDQSLKNWQNRTQLNLNEEFIDLNSDLVLISIEHANEPIPSKASKTRFIKSFRKEGLFMLLSFFTLFCIIVGFFNVLYWLLCLIF